MLLFEGSWDTIQGIDEEYQQQGSLEAMKDATGIHPNNNFPGKRVQMAFLGKP